METPTILVPLKFREPGPTRAKLTRLNNAMTQLIEYGKYHESVLASICTSVNTDE